MKRRAFTIVAVLLMGVTVSAQKFLNNENVIFHSPLVAPAAICAIDLDGDADIDVIAALEDKIFWYENIGGDSIFKPLQDIKTLTTSIKSLHTADLNGDGHIDIVATYYNKIIWFENSGANGVFGTQQEIASLTANIKSLYITDLNGDNHIDLLVAYDENMVWFENTGTDGQYGLVQPIDVLTEDLQYIYASDLDGDLDMDMICVTKANDELVWYENSDGNATFVKKQVITNMADYVQSIYTADLDGDGDMDILSASAFDDKIAWYKNTDGQGTFSEQIVIATTADYPQYVYAEDLDGDGDMDPFSASFFDDKVAWYENTDGAGTFAAEQVISTLADQAGYVYAGDLDGDGDKDVITASCDFKIAWHENTLPLQIVDNPSSRFVPLDGSLTLGVSANEFVTAYQWQVNTGEGFTVLANAGVYSGVDSDSLLITGFTAEMSGYKYQCVTTGGSNELISDPAILMLAPGDQTVEADANCQAILSDYTGGLDFIQTPAASLYDKIAGNTQVSLISRDTVNPQILTFNVDVIDITPPVFIGFQDDQTIEVNAEGEVYLPNYLNYDIETSDNCSFPQEIEIIQAPNAYTIITDTTQVTITATDVSGNSVQRTFNVNIVDNLQPTILCQDDQLIKIGEGEGFYQVVGNQFDPSAVFDNYEIQSVVNNFNDSSSLEDAEFIVGTTNVIWTVTDVSGNTAQCDFDITVEKLSVIEQLQQKGISIFPNPSDGIVYYESLGTPISSLEVIDFTGRILIERSKLDSEGMIDMSAFSDGIYQCLINTSEKQYTIKIVIGK